jgi:hypothetical protein
MPPVLHLDPEVINPDTDEPSTPSMIGPERCDLGCGIMLYER